MPLEATGAWKARGHSACQKRVSHRRQACVSSAYGPPRLQPRRPAPGPRNTPAWICQARIEQGCLKLAIARVPPFFSPRPGPTILPRVPFAFGARAVSSPSRRSARMRNAAASTSNCRFLACSATGLHPVPREARCEERCRRERHDRVLPASVKNLAVGQRGAVTRESSGRTDGRSGCRPAVRRSGSRRRQ